MLFWILKQVSCFAYRAPEQTGEGFGRKGSHTDVWGFATTVLHLATGQLPYQGLTQHQMLTAMIKKRAPTVADTLPARLQQLLKQCLQFDTNKRPSVPALLQLSQHTAFPHIAYKVLTNLDTDICRSVIAWLPQMIIVTSQPCL